METHSPIKKWAGLIILSLALAIIVIDTTLLNVSLRTIIIDLKTDIESMQWVITAYSLMLAAFTITGGRLGDLFGRKRMFVLGALIFAIGSFLASISTNVGMLIAGEAIIEGIGAALMMPATSSLLVANFKGRERAIAFGVWGGVAAASSAVGPILGGWLTTHYSWRWGFRINVVVAAILAIGSLIISDSRDTEEAPTLDIVGVVLSALGMLSLVYGLIQSSKYGWLTQADGSLSPVIVFVVLGFVVLGLFGYWEKSMMVRGKTPLVSLNLFRNQQFTSGAITMAIIALGQSGLFFSMPIFFQGVRGYDALQTGIAMVPLSITLLFAAPLSAYFSKYISPKKLIQIGLGLNILAYIALSEELAVTADGLDFILGYVLFGLGFGMIMAQISNLTLSAVSVQEAGEASGVNNTLRQLGTTLGSAILGSVLISTLGTSMVVGIMGSVVIPEQAKAGIIQGIASQSASLEFGGGPELSSALPDSIRNEIVSISHQATVGAAQTSLGYGCLFAYLGFIASLWLPDRKNVERGESLVSAH